MTKYLSPSDIDCVFSPSAWWYVIANPEKSYTAQVPTIYDYIEKFGYGYAVMWVREQVMALYGSSSNKDKEAANGIRIFCESFTAQVKSYKLSELMLFFARYKAGKYDNSFYSFDTRRIGNAFFREFIPERNFEINSITRKILQEDIEKRRFVPPDGYTCLEWRDEIRRRAASGDEEAIRMLMTP